MKKLLFAILLLSPLYIFSQLEYQISEGKYFIEFIDKDNNNYNLNNPEDFLSEKSLNRRENQFIELDQHDLPVSNYYLDSLTSLGLEITNISKWLNGAIVASDDLELLDTIENLSFVSNIAKPHNSTSTKTNNYNKLLFKGNKTSVFDYGEETADQLFIHNLPFLHNQGYTGRGLTIAVIDGGFQGLYNPDNHSFDSIITNNQILYTYNVVEKNNIIDIYGTHGMSVLSTICANIEDEFTGSAPHADYLLIITENPESERIIEEIHWCIGAELADSLGADLINSSLGYGVFDNDSWTHTPEQLDGNTTYVTKAANIASQRGILVVNSAGNEGDEPAPNITAPADSPLVLSVGAINRDSVYASFSGEGPTFDQRIKPDVVGVGKNTFVQKDTYIDTNNGTSFSSPIVCGVAACLWQAFPYLTNAEIKEALMQSSHLADNPNNNLGYGIPNMQLAYQNLTSNKVNSQLQNNNVNVYPNPNNGDFTLTNVSKAKVQIISPNGNIIQELYSNTDKINIQPKAIAKGIYFLKIIYDNTNKIVVKKVSIL